jgi:hypothetical protein
MASQKEMERRVLGRGLKNTGSVREADCAENSLLTKEVLGRLSNACSEQRHKL